MTADTLQALVRQVHTSLGSVPVQVAGTEEPCALVFLDHAYRLVRNDGRVEPYPLDIFAQDLRDEYLTPDQWPQELALSFIDIMLQQLQEDTP